MEKSTETKAETELTTDNSTVKNITDKVSDNTKTIANEQILANVEYSQETPEINLEKIKNMTPQELKALVENIQKILHKPLNLLLRRLKQKEKLSSRFCRKFITGSTSR